MNLFCLSKQIKTHGFKEKLTLTLRFNGQRKEEQRKHLKKIELSILIEESGQDNKVKMWWHGDNTYHVNSKF